MSQWFKDRRQEFIAATLRQFGQVRRADLMREFDISTPQAATDIAAFLATDPPHVRYDVSAKVYVLDDPLGDAELAETDDLSADLMRQSQLIEQFGMEAQEREVSDLLRRAAQALRNNTALAGAGA